MAVAIEIAGLVLETLVAFILAIMLLRLIILYADAISAAFTRLTRRLSAASNAVRNGQAPAESSTSAANGRAPLGSGDAANQTQDPTLDAVLEVHGGLRLTGRQVLQNAETWRRSNCANGLDLDSNARVGRLYAFPCQEDAEAAADEDGDCCNICLEEYIENVSIREVEKCRHFFHRVCIDKWLRDYPNPTCPTCRVSLAPEAPEPAPAAPPSDAPDAGQVQVQGQDLSQEQSPSPSLSPSPSSSSSPDFSPNQSQSQSQSQRQFQSGSQSPSPSPSPSSRPEASPSQSQSQSQTRSPSPSSGPDTSPSLSSVLSQGQCQSQSPDSSSMGSQDQLEGWSPGPASVVETRVETSPCPSAYGDLHVIIPIEEEEGGSSAERVIGDDLV